MRARILELIRLTLTGRQRETTSLSSSQDRYRRAARTALASLAGRGVGVATALVTVPLALDYLGTERYGMWMAVASAVNLLTFADLGLGIGLQNALVHCHGKQDKQSPGFYTSTAFAAVAVVALTVAAFALWVMPSIPLDRFVKLRASVNTLELLRTAQTVLLVFGLGTVVGLFERAYSAYQEGYLANAWLTAGRLAGFLLILTCIWVKAPLPLLVASLSATPLVFLALGGLLLLRRRPWLRLSVTKVRISAFKTIGSVGLLGLLARLAMGIISGGVPLVIAAHSGAESVTPYSLAFKGVEISLLVLTASFMPLWPAYGEAAARGDHAWVRRTFFRCLRMAALIYIPIFLAMTLSGRELIRLWVGKPEAVPSLSLLLACSTFGLVNAWNAVASPLLNGLNWLRGQATYGFACALLGFVASYYLSAPGDVSRIVWIVVIFFCLRSACQIVEVSRALKWLRGAAKVDLVTAGI